MSAFSELESFLKSENTEIRKVAAGHLCSLSPTNECVDYFRNRKLDLIISKLQDHQLISVDILRFLINISRDKTIQETLTDSKELYALLSDMIIDVNNPISDLACMMLSNITLTEKGCQNLLELKGKQTFRSLIEILAAEKSPNPKANFHYLALVFANVTQVDEGRKALFTDRGKSPLKKLPKLIHTNKVILKGGVLSGLKNCCFETEHGEWLVEEGRLLENVLSLLALPTDLDEDEKRTAPKYLLELSSDKKRESDLHLLAVALDIILLLCSTNARVRKTLRDSHVYPIIRETDKGIEEQHDHIKETIYGIVNLLVRDENPAEEEEITVIE